MAATGFSLTHTLPGLRQRDALAAAGRSRDEASTPSWLWGWDATSGGGAHRHAGPRGCRQRRRARPGAGDGGGDARRDGRNLRDGKAVGECRRSGGRRRGGQLRRGTVANLSGTDAATLLLNILIVGEDWSFDGYNLPALLLTAVAKLRVGGEGAGEGGELFFGGISRPAP